MNWKLTRPGNVSFTKGEPIAMLLPQRRGELERFTCSKAALDSDSALAEGYRTWITQRQGFLAAQRRGQADAVRQKYQKHYFNGSTSAGVFLDGHQKRRALAAFEQ